MGDMDKNEPEIKETKDRKSSVVEDAKENVSTQSLAPIAKFEESSKVESAINEDTKVTKHSDSEDIKEQDGKDKEAAQPIMSVPNVIEEPTTGEKEAQLISDKNEAD